MEQLSGNTQGLSPSDKKLLERIFRRRVDPQSIVSPELASFMCECSHKVQRQVGILLDRKGIVEHVIVGDQHKLYLPDLGPRRGWQSATSHQRLVVPPA